MFIRVNKELKVLSGTGEPASPYEVPALLYNAPPDQLTFDIGGITPSYTAGPPYSLQLTVTNTPSGHDQLVIAASGFLSPGRKVPKANRIPYVADFAANTTAHSTSRSIGTPSTAPCSTLDQSPWPPIPSQIITALQDRATPRSCPSHEHASATGNRNAQPTPPNLPIRRPEHVK